MLYLGRLGLHIPGRHLLQRKKERNTGHPDQVVLPLPPLWSFWYSISVQLLCLQNSPASPSLPAKCLVFSFFVSIMKNFPLLHHIRSFALTKQPTVWGVSDHYGLDTFYGDFRDQFSIKTQFVLDGSDSIWPKSVSCACVKAVECLSISQIVHDLRLKQNYTCHIRVMYLMSCGKSGLHSY